MARKLTHRSFAGWTIDALIAEMDRLAISRTNDSAFVRYLDTNGHRTGRYCMVEAIIRAQAS